jgi:hypothetical protein
MKLRRSIYAQPAIVQEEQCPRAPLIQRSQRSSTAFVEPREQPSPRGDQDRYLGRELAEPDRAWVPEVRVERISEASHWVQADAPERVNQLMLDFLEPIRG